MTQNPFINAFAATAYIALIASIMFYFPKPDAPGIITPVAVLSLFVLSASLMGYFFLYTPAKLFLANEQAEATKLFLSTVAIFAVFTAAILAGWYFIATTLQ